MINNETTLDQSEIAKFAQHANAWWDPEGSLKTLHDINPARITFIEQFQPLHDQRVLDVGCGGGILCEGMAKQQAHVTGLDVEEGALAAASEHASAQGLSIVYVNSAVEEYESEPFDCITCMEMLEHVANPALVIQHCARLLKPQGYLFLSTINRTLKAYTTVVLAAEYLLNLLPRQTHDYQKFIKPSELVTLTRQWGLEAAGLSGLGYHPFTRTASIQTSVAGNYLLACQKLG